jgi:hypothetical protein
MAWVGAFFLVLTAACVAVPADPGSFPSEPPRSPVVSESPVVSTNVRLVSVSGTVNKTGGSEEGACGSPPGPYAWVNASARTIDVWPRGDFDLGRLVMVIWERIDVPQAGSCDHDHALLLEHEGTIRWGQLGSTLRTWDFATDGETVTVRDQHLAPGDTWNETVDVSANGARYTGNVGFLHDADPWELRFVEDADDGNGQWAVAHDG